MRVGTRHPQCVMLCLNIAVHRSNAARSLLCPSRRHPIFVSVHRSGMAVPSILRRQRYKEKESGIRFLGIAACSKWGSSLRCEITCVYFSCLTFYRRQRAARQHVDRAVQSVGDKLRNAKATRRSAGRTYTFDP